MLCLCVWCDPVPIHTWPICVCGGVVCHALVGTQHPGSWLPPHLPVISFMCLITRWISHCIIDCVHTHTVSLILTHIPLNVLFGTHS